jgi:hypothetical protein
MKKYMKMKKILLILMISIVTFINSQTHQDCLNAGFVFDSYSGGASGVCIWKDENGNLVCSWGNSSVNWEIACMNNCPNATYYFGTGNEGRNYCKNVIIPLPINLSHFSVTNYNGVNIIKWETESEQNNDYFTLERSIDGEDWIKIQQMVGAGNSSNITRYSFSDYEFKDTINYYRLVQYDFDGRFESFNIIAIDNRDERILLKTTIYDIMGRVYSDLEQPGLYIIHKEYEYGNIEVSKIYVNY